MVYVVYVNRSKLNIMNALRIYTLDFTGRMWCMWLPRRRTADDWMT